MEEGEEAGEPADEADGGEFEDALEEVDEVEVGEVVEAVLEQGHGVLSAGDEDYDGEKEAFEGAAEDEGPSDVGGAGVDGLVDEGGGPPEVAEVCEGDVVGVEAGFVEAGECA